MMDIKIDYFKYEINFFKDINKIYMILFQFQLRYGYVLEVFYYKIIKIL